MRPLVIPRKTKSQEGVIPPEKGELYIKLNGDVTIKKEHHTQNRLILEPLDRETGFKI